MHNQLKFQGSLNVKLVNFFSGLDTMAKRSHTVISHSILDHAREDSERLDWLTVCPMTKGLLMMTPSNGFAVRLSC